MHRTYLQSESPDLRYEALLAAGHWELAKAWPAIARLAADPHIDNTTLLAVIDAAAEIGLPESVTFLRKLLYADDDDIVDAAHEALGLLEGDEFDDAFD